MGTSPSKSTKNFNVCKSNCWNNIKKELNDGFINTNSFEFRLYKNREIMTIGCNKCTVKCSDDCMTIVVLVEVKARGLDSGYSVITFKNYDAALHYINQFYPDGTTKANKININNPYPENNPDYYRDKILYKSKKILSSKNVYNEIKALYSK